MPHAHHHGADAGSERRLLLMLVLTGLFLVVEAVTGWLVGSLALLADAAHMITDTSALGLAVAAIRLGRRPADDQRTFGYRRWEVLAATGNALGLLAVAVWILFEAWQRFVHPPEIHSLPMLIVAVIGLAVNGAGIFILRPAHGHSLNVHGAYLEVLSDLLGSAAVIVAALVIRYTGWKPVDPLLAALVGLWVVPRTWRLLNRSLHVLLEGVPENVDFHRLRRDLAALPAVKEVHDLHVWSLTTGEPSLTVHLVVATGDLSVVRGAQGVARRHGIEHATIQVEDERNRCPEHAIHRPVARARASRARKAAPAHPS